MPDWNRKKKIAEIREALEKATPRWHDNGNEIVSLDNPRVGIGGFVWEEDNYLAVNAPKWLRFLLSELERKDDIIEEQKTALFRNSKEIMELRKKSWQFVLVCWNCGKEHSSDVPLNQRPYLCECGGYVVSPSGKIQGKWADGKGGDKK